MRMHVTLGAIEARRFAQERNESRRLEVARFSRLHLGVARLLQHQRQPADLELGAGRDDEIGAARARDQARARVDVMRILQRVGRGVHGDLVAAELLGEGTPFGNGREYVERRRRRRDPRRDERGEQNVNGFHRSLLQYLWAPWAPRLKMYWMNHWLSVTSGRVLLCENCKRRRLNSDGDQSIMALVRSGLNAVEPRYAAFEP